MIEAFLENKTTPKTIFLICLLTSSAPIIFYHSYYATPAPGRGGAIGVAISFAYLFLGRRSGAKAFKIIASLERAEQLRQEKLGPISVDLSINQRYYNLIKRIIDTDEIDEKEKARANNFLFLASVVSTVAWGFGDKFAYWLDCMLNLFD